MKITKKITQALHSEVHDARLWGELARRVAAVGGPAAFYAQLKRDSMHHAVEAAEAVESEWREALGTVQLPTRSRFGLRPAKAMAKVQERIAELEAGYEAERARRVAIDAGQAGGPQVHELETEIARLKEELATARGLVTIAAQRRRDRAQRDNERKEKALGIACPTCEAAAHAPCDGGIMHRDRVADAMKPPAPFDKKVHMSTLHGTFLPKVLDEEATERALFPDRVGDDDPMDSAMTQLQIDGLATRVVRRKRD